MKSTPNFILESISLMSFLVTTERSNSCLWSNSGKYKGLWGLSSQSNSTRQTITFLGGFSSFKGFLRRDLIDTGTRCLFHKNEEINCLLNQFFMFVCSSTTNKVMCGDHILYLALKIMFTALNGCDRFEAFTSSFSFTIILIDIYVSLLIRFLNNV